MLLFKLVFILVLILFAAFWFGMLFKKGRKS
jgi:hypothetical protein